MTMTAPDVPNPASGCNVHAALADEREHVAALRRADPQADAANPLGQPIGLALSGGGIRSATVGLGALQAFAEKRLLQRIDYLSTVSGGGYIGAWFSAMLRSQQNPLVPEAGIGTLEALIAPSDIREKDEEPAEIAFLRAYSNYLTPRLGLFSLDTLAALTGYARNLVLSLSLAVFSIGSVLAVLHLLVLGVALESGHRSWRGAYDLASVLLRIAAFFVSLLLTLQAEDVRGQLPAGVNRGNWLLGLQIIQHLFSSYYVLPMVAAGLALAGTFVESQLPFSPIWSETFQLGLGVLLWVTGGALIAKLVVRLGSNTTGDIDEAAFVRNLVFWTWQLKSFGREWLVSHWREALRYVVASLLSTVVAWQLLRLVGQLEPVAPAIALFRGPALVIAISLAVFVVWLGVIGTTYSELTREWLSRLMGRLVGAVLAWLAIGAILINARPLMLFLLAGRWHLAVETSWLLPLALLALLTALVRNTRPATTAVDAPVRHRLVALAIPAACTLIVVLFLAALTVAFQDLLIRIVPPGGTEPPGDGSYRGFMQMHLAQIGRALEHVGFDVVPPMGWSWASVSAWFDESWAALPIISLALTCFAGALLAFRYVDVNVFSLQNLYRNRLVRCYLGAGAPTPATAEPVRRFRPGRRHPTRVARGAATVPPGQRRAEHHAGRRSGVAATQGGVVLLHASLVRLLVGGRENGRSGR